MIDAHVHLTDVRLKDRIPFVLRDAYRAGVTGMVTCGTSPDDWDAVLRFLTNPRHDSVAIKGAIGLHPWYADVHPEWEKFFCTILSENPAISVGEIGLDQLCSVDFSVQTKVFKRQLELALDFGRPVSIHCVRCWSELLAILRSVKKPVPGIVHGFSASVEVMMELVDLGLSVSFAASVTNPHATRARKAAKWVDADRFVLETDAPDMLPHPLKVEGSLTVNEPKYLGLIAQAVSEIREESLDSVVDISCQNMIRLFGSF